MFGLFKRIKPASLETREEHRIYPVDVGLGEVEAPDVTVNSALEAMKINAVWSAVSLVSGDIAKMPMTVLRFGEPMTGHRLYRLLRYSPRPGQSGYRFWRRLVANLMLHGACYVEIVRSDDGRLMHLHELDPGTCRYVRSDDGRDGRYRISRRGQQPDYRLPDEVLHFSWLDEADNAPWNTLTQARGNLSLALAQEEYQKSFIDRGGHSAGILEVPRAMGKDARDHASDSFAKNRSGRRGWFRTAVLRDGATWQGTSDSFNDQQLLELRQMAVEDVCRWFNIPPAKLGLKSSISFASSVEATRSYVNETLGTWLRAIESELEYKLLRSDELGVIDVTFDRERLFVDQPDVDEETSRPDESQGRRDVICEPAGVA